MIKNPPAMQERMGWEDLLEKGMATTPVFLPGEFHGQSSLTRTTVLGITESDITERLNTHTYMYEIYILFQIFSLMEYCKILSTVPCATQ